MHAVCVCTHAVCVYAHAVCLYACHVCLYACCVSVRMTCVSVCIQCVFAHAVCVYACHVCLYACCVHLYACHVWLYACGVCLYACHVRRYACHASVRMHCVYTCHVCLYTCHVCVCTHAVCVYACRVCLYACCVSVRMRCVCTHALCLRMPCVCLYTCIVCLRMLCCVTSCHNEVTCNSAWWCQCPVVRSTWTYGDILVQFTKCCLKACGDWANLRLFLTVVVQDISLRSVILSVSCVLSMKPLETRRLPEHILWDVGHTLLACIFMLVSGWLLIMSPESLDRNLHSLFYLL